MSILSTTTSGVSGAIPAVSNAIKSVFSNRVAGMNPPTQAPDMSSIYQQDPNKATTTLNGISYNYAGDPIKTASAPAVDPYVKSAQDLLAQIKAQNASNVYTGKTPDFAAVQAQSRAAAEANVNPYYTKTLNDFLAQQAASKSQQQVQTDLTIKNAQDSLKQLQDANAVTGDRATADTATTEGQINATADQRQTDQGQAFDTENIANQIAAARNGLTGSGLSAGQNTATQNKFNTTESRQAQGDQNAIDHAELAKARTFEDLATSNKNATNAEGKAENAANINLTDFITNQGFQTEQQKTDLEKQRLQAVAQEQQNQSKIAINKFLLSISNPAQKAAFARTYGSYL